MSKPIHFGVVGLGHIGKRHAKMILDNPLAKLVAVSDLRGQSETQLNSDAVYYNSLDEMLRNEPEIEVVSIATPNGLHARQALMALEHNKHVVIEKPMALTKADCERVLFKALHKRKQVFCVMQNRYSPASVWLKEMVESGALGQIYMVTVDCFWNRDDRYYKAEGWHGSKKLDGGTLFTQFSHFVDIVYWLFGDIHDVKADLFDFNHNSLTDFEDSGLITFKFQNGGFGSFNYSTAVWDANFESTLTVIAENGTVKVGGQYMNEVHYCHVKNYVMPELPKSNEANDYGGYKGSAANHNFIFDNVVEVLHEKSAITTNAMEGLKVVEIIENIYKSSAAYLKTLERKKVLVEK